VPQLSDMAIRSAKPAVAAYTLWDDATAGFGCRVYPGGQKSFIVLIGSGRRQTIGRYNPPHFTLSDARTEARRILAEKTLGKVRPTHTAFEDAVVSFLAEREKTLRPRTLADYKRLLTKHYPYGRTSLASVTPRMILTRLKGLPQAERHHAFAAGRAFYRYCAANHLIDRSPMADMEPPAASKARERVLSQDELKRAYTAAIAGNTAFHRIIALCLLTGQRRGEIARLERSWLKDDLITIPSTVTKNGRTHTFPIGLQAKAVLETIPEVSDHYFFPAARESVKGKPATVFNGWGKPKTAFDRESRVNDWTIHDIRRCVSSGMAALGINQVVVEKLLNHVSGGSLSQIAAIYNRHQYLDEMREAVEKWERYLARLLAAE
jgi:integrase